MAAFSLFWLTGGFMTSFKSPASPKLTALPRRLMGQPVGLREAGVLISDHLLLPKLRHQESAWVVFRPAVNRQPHVVPAHDLIRGLLLVLQPVDFLDAERNEGER